MYGYSVDLVSLNKQASIRNLGVKLGRRCIAAHYPVSKVATRCNVTRAAVYNWFKGLSKPRERHVGLIKGLLAEINTSIGN